MEPEPKPVKRLARKAPRRGRKVPSGPRDLLSAVEHAARATAAAYKLAKPYGKKLLQKIKRRRSG